MSETKQGLAEFLFEAALQKTDPAERSAFLDGVCRDEPALRARLELLLEGHFQGEGFLTKNPERVTLTVEPPPSEPPSPMIGRYKLLEKIGEGGFGEVWMAEQREPVKRRVALKIIKLGMDSRQIVARFEAERQALAMMDHANIAKIFDASVTDTGRPYFVMELVRGIKITEYCDQNQLPTQERLRLFILVCQAIQHAHQKGIIHRDIKPSNILVTLHDGAPVPKVIDFGIAKATQGELTDKTVFTQFQQFIGTPAYISPEQAEMSGLDIDTRADIYSLGVLLYELLVGQTPFDAKEMMQGGIDALRQIIREKEPLRPSTKLNTLQGDARTTAGKRRQTDVRKLVHQLQGDLDWIVMKCLEKDRTRRYETANGLAADLKRYLNDEPVVARPPSTAYRFQKAWRRNKLVYTAGVTVFLALAVGLTLAALGWLQALTQRRQAQTNEERAILAREETRRRAYVAEVNVAFQALAENNLGRAIELLNRQRPGPGEEDLRGFEWRHLWQLCRPDEKFTFHNLGALCAAFSPDGRWLAYAGDRIVIRELSSQAVVTNIPMATSTLAFSPTGKLLASGHGSQVKLWSTESWREERLLTNTRAPAVFSPDGRWLVTGIGEEYRDDQWRPQRYGFTTGTNSGYLVWSTETWTPAGFCPGEPTWKEQAFQSVTFSPDGKLLVTAGHPGGRDVAQFQVWDFPSLTVRTNFEFFPFKLSSAVFTPDGEHLLTGDWFGELLVWDVATGRVVDSLNPHTGRITTVAYARDGRTFATASSDRTLVVWDGETRKELVRLRGHFQEIHAMALSPDGRMLASGSLDGTTKLWDATIRHERRNLRDFGLIAGFSADGRRVVLQGFNSFILWRLDDDAVTPIPLDQFHFRGLDTWADVQGTEPFAVFGQANGTVEFWNLGTMSRLKSWHVSDTEVSVAALSPDARFVATNDKDRQMKLWDVATAREVRRLPPLEGRMSLLSFSPTGRFLAGVTIDPDHVGIWDVDTGRLLRELDTRGEWVRSLAFSPDGKLLATGCQNNTAQLWDIPSGKQKATLRGHVQEVVGVAFSPDGRTLVTSGDDRKVKLWNIATRQEVATLELLRGACRSIRFSPDGRALVVGHFRDPEPYAWAWQVPSFEEIAAAEAKAKTESKQP